MAEPYVTVAQAVPSANTSPERDSSESAFIRKALQRFQSASTYESKRRTEALADVRFAAGEQWEAWVQEERKRLGRPCLMANRVPQFLNQVSNDQRQNRPSIQINPVGGGADRDTAEIMEGIVRHIQIRSDAEVAYDTAFMQMITMGFGFFRLVIKYVEPRTPDNDMELAVEWIPDPFKVYFDPSAKKPDWSDAQWAFIAQDMTRDEFVARWPKADVASINALQSTGDQDPIQLWIQGGNIRVAEYFYTEPGTRQIATVVGGVEMYLDDVPEGIQIMSVRTVDVIVVKQAIINAVQVLEESEWVASSIPIIPVLGQEIRRDGDREFVGMVRYAKDAQRMYNLGYTSLIEAMALMPKAQYIAEVRQVEGFESEWKNANTNPVAVLRYRATTSLGQPVGAPQRVNASTDLTPMVAAIQQSDNNLKAIFGIYDASLGQRGPDESGRAIIARQRESDVANYNFIDNMNRAIRNAGRQLVEAIPRIYNRPGRVIHIVGLDEERKPVVLNQPFMNGPKGPQALTIKDIDQAQSDQAAMIKFYDIRVGTYDVAVTAGPSYTTKRQEATANLIQLTQANPYLMQVAGDLIVGQMDWYGAKAIAERLKKALPPQLQDTEDGQQQIPPQIQAQMQQSQAMIDQLTQTVHGLVDKLDKQNADLASKERIALEGNATALIIETIRQEHAANKIIFEQTLNAITKRLELLQVDQPVGSGATPPQGGPAPKAQPVQ